MKKIIILAVLAMLGLETQAQLVTSRSSMKRTEVTEEKVVKNGWSTFGFEYLPSSFKPKGESSQSFTGIALTWTTAQGISASLPLYVEAGLGVQWSFYKETEEVAYSYTVPTYSYSGGYSYTTQYGYHEVDAKLNMISMKVPINLIYSYQVPNTNISLDPYVGLRLRFNVFGEIDYDGETANIFDKDDMGSSDNTWNRFQIGWQIGAKIRLGGVFFGAAYGTDFSDIVKDTSINEGQLSFGFVF